MLKNYSCEGQMELSDFLKISENPSSQMYCKENAGMISGQKKTRTIKHSRINRRVLAGVTGINQESRSIGVGEVLFIQSASVITMLNILAVLWKIV